MNAATETIIHANGVALCIQGFGNPADPAILLVMGATASMLGWDEEFCRLLAAGHRYVIRYDHRDTGRSTTYPPGSPAYTLDDLAEDAVGMLDACGIDCAHLVGMSLGGMIVQLVAINHPERLLTATLIASSPHGPEDPDLPDMEEKIQAYFSAERPPLDWSDEAAVIADLVTLQRLVAGRGRTFGEERARDVATRQTRRAPNVASMRNHALIDGQRWRERLGEVTTPTLVIHGTDDPILPYGHGLALAREIPGASLLTLEGAGHELHPADWERVTEAILRHTSLPAASENEVKHPA